MQGIELDRDAQVFDRFLKIPAFLKNLVAKAVASQKSLGILGHHLPERIEIHYIWSNLKNWDGELLEAACWVGSVPFRNTSFTP